MAYVQTIAENSFSGCTGLTTLTIGKSINAIGSEAFNGCIGLKDVNCYAQNVPLTSSDSFNNSNIENAVLHVPGRVIDLYKESIPWNKFKEILKINLPEHTLFYIVDGEVYKKYNIEEGDNITPEAAPTKEGYTFSGWSEIPQTMPANDVTVTGTFTINKYKLIYKVDGAEFKSYDIEYGASITPEAAPTKEGYTFSGWSEIPEKMPANDVTVTGTFTINKYKLTYIVDGEEYKSYEIDYGSSISLENAPIKEGYTFSGWSEIPQTMPANDVTVIGTFTINKYKLTYMVDGEVYKTYEVEYGATITPEPAPNKEGYDFSGWDNVPETMPAHDVTVNGSLTVGITDILINSGEVKIFDMKGNQIGKLQKGINILVYKNGKTKKVVMK